MENNETFQTPDPNVAAAVWAAGGEFVRAERTSYRTIAFIFRPLSLCRAAADEFWRGALSVNARDFTDRQRTLKDIMFAKLRDQKNGDGEKSWTRPPLSPQTP